MLSVPFAARADPQEAVFTLTMREWTTLALVVMAALARPVSALQASDVGVVDWHLPLIGPPRVPLATEAPLHRFHHTSISDNPDALKKSLLLTVTEENVLAALQPSSGDVGALLVLAFEKS